MRRTSSALVATALLATALAVQIHALPADDDRAIVHLLNRIGFGPRPGDIENVRRMGLERYIEWQLHPEQIDDAVVQTRLSDFATLTMSSRQIADRYERPLLEARRDRKQDAAMADPNAVPTNQPPRDPAQQAGAIPMMELSQQKIIRAVYSERQLQEVLTDFWFNHFNVDARKGQSRFMLTEYERDAIRPHVLGRFRDLLEATAKSPAMLFYLDNWMSADPNGPHLDQMTRARRGGGQAAGRRRFGVQPPPRPQGNMPAARPQRPNMPRGLNENYGRELLELHTLGVDGGYTQKDVTEVARAFTGWTIDQPRQGGGYRFMPALHDDREKTILGHVIKAGGDEGDGQQVLDILAKHPSTARFISTKLARRFVSDEPPAPLIDRMAATFQKTDGDLRAVMTVLLTSSEFRSPAVYNAKVKTPLEFVISAVRATRADLSDPRPLVRAMEQLGMPLYRCQPPTGYKDTSDAWINTGALVNRMNVALTLAGGQQRTARIPDDVRPESVVASGLSETTTATIAKAATRPQAMALALGSPEFQRR